MSNSLGWKLVGNSKGLELLIAGGLNRLPFKFKLHFRKNECRWVLTSENLALCDRGAGGGNTFTHVFHEGIITRAAAVAESNAFILETLGKHQSLLDAALLAATYVSQCQYSTIAVPMATDPKS